MGCARRSLRRIQHSTFNTEHSTFAFRRQSRMLRMTDFQTRTIPATVHGRYLVRDGPPERLLVGFHGYGETAEAHMEELRQIPGIDRWTAVAVQALHPFYVSRTGMIVGSWMTNLDRVLAIEDNRVFVLSVVTESPARQQ